MEEKIIAPHNVKRVLKFKVKIHYDNGANETIFPVEPPNVNPVTPMLMDFVIKRGLVRHVNMTKVRNMDIEVTEDTDMKILT